MFLHSRYDPLREAERYIDAVGISFIPFCIVVSEPGDSWLARVLKKRYPDTLLVALRYDSEQFENSDALWTAVWRPNKFQSPDDFLFSIIPDEYLPLTVFLAWKPADAIWPVEAERVWQSIASLIRLQKDVMYTRSKFGRKWLGNMVRNFMLAGNPVRMNLIESPVFLSLSGPSLETQFPFNNESFYICAASSALSALHFRGCHPDLCLATDGGNWALPLFNDLESGIPVAFPLEAAIPPRVLASHPAIFLSYGSALEQDFFSMLGIDPDPVFRNGTVAGTAIRYLLSRSSSRIYVAGLDLQNSASFSHARPHPSIMSLESASCRLDPTCTALFARNRDSMALETYARWFSNNQKLFEKRVFRLQPEGRQIPEFPTANIREVATDEVAKPVKPLLRALNLPDISERRESMAAYLKRCADTLHACREEQDAVRKGTTFTNGMTGKTACAELLQFVSYTDYLNALKAVRMDEQSGAKAIDRLCDASLVQINRLSEKVSLYA